jgi:hypothetical protein
MRRDLTVVRENGGQAVLNRLFCFVKKYIVYAVTFISAKAAEASFGAWRNVRLLIS